MSEAKFQVLEMRDCSPQDWLSWWAKRYEEETDDDKQYHEIAKRAIFACWIRRCSPTARWTSAPI